MVTEPLFDATRYGPGRFARTKALDTAPTVTNEGEWYLVLRHNQAPHTLAHQLDTKVMTIYVDGKRTMAIWDGRKPWDGAWRTMCGLLGAVIQLPRGEVRACPKCKDQSP